MIGVCVMAMYREWDLHRDLPLIEDRDIPGTNISPDEQLWINHWDSLVSQFRAMSGDKTTPLPGFPIWANEWTPVPARRKKALREAAHMAWKISHLEKNYRLYDDLHHYDAEWLQDWLSTVRKFPPSRQKLEWQAQRAEGMWKCVISLRPSGLRVKRLTHLPALVAISQTPIIGPLGRRLSVTEGARLQGLPDEFHFPQRDAASWKQLGNGVNTGVVAQALLAQVTRDQDLLTADARGQRLYDAITKTMADTGGDLRPLIRDSVLRGQAHLTAL